MTTAHRPTFDPAVGKEAQRGPAYHQRLLPAHKQLKVRKPGQGGAADGPRDLRAELLAAEAAHTAKKNGGSAPEFINAPTTSVKHMIEDGSAEEEDIDAKRRRILEETRDIDADSSGEEEDSDSDSDSDSEDEQEALQRELHKIKRERAEQREKEEREKAEQDEAERERDVAGGNPLLNQQPKDFGVKRRWDDDVVFRNQARGTDDKDKKKEFINVSRMAEGVCRAAANMDIGLVALRLPHEIYEEDCALERPGMQCYVSTSLNIKPRINPIPNTFRMSVSSVPSTHGEIKTKAARYLRQGQPKTPSKTLLGSSLA